MIFSLLGFIVKKTKTLFFFQLPHTFLVTKHNHNTKYNHKTYKKTSGAMVSQICTSLPSYWCWGKDLHPMISVRDNGFSGRGQNEFWCREEKRAGEEMERGEMDFHFSSYVLSYVFKSVVELELFSNLRHFKNYFPW